MGAEPKTLPGCDCGETDCPGWRWACEVHEDRVGRWQGMGVAAGKDGVAIRELHWCDECHVEQGGVVPFPIEVEANR